MSAWTPICSRLALSATKVFCLVEGVAWSDSIFFVESIFCQPWHLIPIFQMLHWTQYISRSVRNSDGPVFELALHTTIFCTSVLMVWMNSSSPGAPILICQAISLSYCVIIHCRNRGSSTSRLQGHDTSQSIPGTDSGSDCCSSSCHTSEGRQVDTSIVSAPSISCSKFVMVVIGRAICRFSLLVSQNLYNLLYSDLPKIYPIPPWWISQIALPYYPPPRLLLVPGSSKDPGSLITLRHRATSVVSRSQYVFCLSVTDMVTCWRLRYV